MYPYGPFPPYHSAPQPGPTHVYYNRGPMFMRRGPRRLFWFGLGGLATYWFIKSKEHKRQMITSQSGEDGRTGHCMGSWGWGNWGDHRLGMKEAQQKMEDNQRKAREQFKEFGSFNSDAVSVSPRRCLMALF
jgi:hypothetical protein